MPDLSADLDRIRAHLACLERAAADHWPAALRAGLAVELAAWRMAAEIAELDRTTSDDFGRAHRLAPERRTRMREPSWSIPGFRSVLIERDPAAVELTKTRFAKPIAPTLDLFGEETSHA